MRKTEEATRWGWEGKRSRGRKGMWEGHGPACRSDISGRRVTFIKCSTNTLGLFACPYFITPLLSLLYRQFNLFFKEATMCLSCSSCSPSFIVLMSTSFFMPALIPAVSQGVYEREVRRVVVIDSCGCAFVQPRMVLCWLGARLHRRCSWRKTVVCWLVWIQSNKT